VKTLMETEIEQATQEFHNGRISVEEFVNQVMSAGREESERHHLLKQLRQVLGDSRQSSRSPAK
jgi:2-iminoacetate synthase ThiH